MAVRAGEFCFLRERCLRNEPLEERGGGGDGEDDVFAAADVAVVDDDDTPANADAFPPAFGSFAVDGAQPTVVPFFIFVSKKKKRVRKKDGGSLSSFFFLRRRAKEEVERERERKKIIVIIFSFFLAQFVSFYCYFARDIPDVSNGASRRDIHSTASSVHSHRKNGRTSLGERGRMISIFRCRRQRQRRRRRRQ